MFVGNPRSRNAEHALINSDRIGLPWGNQARNDELKSDIPVEKLTNTNWLLLASLIQPRVRKTFHYFYDLTSRLGNPKPFLPGKLAGGTLAFDIFSHNRSNLRRSLMSS